MYPALQFVCDFLFCVSVPILLYIRATEPRIRWDVLLFGAVAFGWIFLNAHAVFSHLEVDRERLEEMACFSHPPPPTITQGESGETIIENPCGIGEYFEESLQPIGGLFYGPAYLIFCMLPCWLIFSKKVTQGMTRPIVWVAVGALAIEWVAIVSRPDSIDSIGYAFEAAGLWAPFGFVVPPLTVSIAFTASWLVVSQIIRRFNTFHALRR